MAWTWMLRDSTGAVTQAGAQHLLASDGEPGAVVEFDSQGDAESFIGETWRALLAAGVDSVVLYDGDTLVYEMSLQPPQV